MLRGHVCPGGREKRLTTALTHPGRERNIKSNQTDRKRVRRRRRLEKASREAIN